MTLYERLGDSPTAAAKTTRCFSFDEKPYWMTSWVITLPLKDGQQTRERYTVMTSDSSSFPVTPIQQPIDIGYHAEIRRLLSYDEEFKNIQGTDEEFKNIQGTDEE